MRLVALAGSMSLVAACSVTDDDLMTGLSAESQTDTAKTADAKTDAHVSGETETASADSTASGDDKATETATTDVDAATVDDGTIEVAEADEPPADESDAPSAVTALSEVEEEKAEPSPFAKLFSRQNAKASETSEQPSERGAPSLYETAESASEPDAEPETDETTTASIASGSPQVRLSVAGDGAALPGVREVRSIYEISSRDRFDFTDYSEDATVQVASAVGLAALAGGRLAVQHANVDVSCFKPRLVSTLRQIENHFGRPVVVTSGYRSKKHNRRVGGARESKHMDCDAADIQVAGVSKWDIAEYVRSLPGRGGVGTYCHTKSVHVDIGTKRDWNWRCRRGN